MPIPKILERAVKSDTTLTNRIIFFLCGIFFSAIFFLTMLKLLGTNGVYLALAISVALNVWLKKNRKDKMLTNSFNNGLITFNILSVSLALIIFIVFFGAIQNLLN